MYYEEVFKTLNNNKVKYVVAGGMAVVLHGFVRFTADLDIIIELKEENIERFFNTLSELGYKPKLPVTKDQFKDKDKRKEWIEEKEMKVFSFFHTKEYLKLIDVFVEEPIPFIEIEKNKEDIKAKDLIIPTLSINHLIRLKKNAGRPQGMIDIKNLEKIKEHNEK